MKTNNELKTFFFESASNRLIVKRLDVVVFFSAILCFWSGLFVFDVNILVSLLIANIIIFAISIYIEKKTDKQKEILIQLLLVINFILAITLITLLVSIFLAF